MTSGARQTRQQRTAQSRERLLLAGLDLLKERLVSPVEGVRSTEVAQRAGFTPGAFYHHWASQEEYRDELRGLIGGQAEIESALDRLSAGFFAEDVNPIEALQLICRNEIAAQAEDPDWHIQLAMLASNHEADLAGSARQYERWSQDLASFYHVVFKALDIKFKAGMNIEVFVVTLSAISEGFALQRRAGTAPVALEGNLADWQPFETAVATLITSWMQRRDGRPVRGETFLEQLHDLLDIPLG